MDYPKFLDAKQWPWRLMLMRKMTSMKATKNLHLKVLSAMKNSQDKEQRAKEILEIVESNIPENEMVTRLEALM